ncbi:MAG: hypothetical protein ACOC8K_02090 [Gemmatimonadota bacterium]
MHPALVCIFVPILPMGSATAIPGPVQAADGTVSATGPSVARKALFSSFGSVAGSLLRLGSGIPLGVITGSASFSAGFTIAGACLGWQVGSLIG